MELPSETGRDDDPEHGPAAAGSVPWDKTLETWNPGLVFALAAGGAVGSALLLLAGSGNTPSSDEFVRSPGFLIWAAVIVAQGAVWVVLVVPVLREVFALYREVKPSLLIWAVPGLVLTALLLLLAFSPAAGFPWPLYGQQAKTTMLTLAAAFLVAIPAVFGICLVQDRLRRHHPTTPSASDIRLAINARAQVRRLLGVAGTVIGLAVLAAGALQRATVPTYISADVFPPSAVVIYGAFFTGLLVLVYFPAHLSLSRLCVDIRNGYYPMTAVPEPTDEHFSAWLERRGRLDALIQINVSAGQQLQASLFILAPLISAVIGIVPKG